MACKKQITFTGLRLTWPSPWVALADILAGLGLILFAIWLPVSWVSLDERDNAPIRFWTYLIAALQTRPPLPGETAFALLKVSQPPPIETILTELLNDAAAFPQNLVLVLDDYHRGCPLGADFLNR